MVHKAREEHKFASSIFSQFFLQNFGKILAKLAHFGNLFEFCWKKKFSTLKGFVFGPDSSLRPKFASNCCRYFFWGGLIKFHISVMFQNDNNHVFVGKNVDLKIHRCCKKNTEEMMIS